MLKERMFLFVTERHDTAVHISIPRDRANIYIYGTYLSSSTKTIAIYACFRPTTS